MNAWLSFSLLTLYISCRDPGFPGGSVVGFAPDEDGRPLFIFSGMSTHTQASRKIVCVIVQYT
jgi:putative heme iron utilization protein